MLGRCPFQGLSKARCVNLHSCYWPKASAALYTPCTTHHCRQNGSALKTVGFCKMSDAQTSTTRDLFGNEIKIKFGDPGAKKKLSLQPRGNAAPIGSGPAGETCRTCSHAYCHKMAGSYWKCALVKPTHSTKTDIRLKWAACARWVKREEESETK